MENFNSSYSSENIETINKIKKLSIVSMILWILEIILIIVYATSVVGVVVGGADTESVINLATIASPIITILMAGCGISHFVINIINAIRILSNDYKNESVNSSKIVWGILTIVILGWIASLIFAITAKNKLSRD